MREPGRAKGTVSAKGLRQKQHRVMVSLTVFVLDTGVLSAMEESLRFEVRGKLSSVVLSCGAPGKSLNLSVILLVPSWGNKGG